MRILVTGSRDWTHGLVIYRALEEARGDTPHDEMVLVHGGAKGADEIAARYATDKDWGIEEHPAEWAKYGRAAGPIRNMGMVDAGADICLAFIKNHSRGATQCAAYAEACGIPVKRYRA